MSGPGLWGGQLEELWRTRSGPELWRRPGPARHPREIAAQTGDAVFDSKEPTSCGRFAGAATRVALSAMQLMLHCGQPMLHQAQCNSCCMAGNSCCIKRNATHVALRATRVALSATQLTCCIAGNPCCIKRRHPRRGCGSDWRACFFRGPRGLAT